jgi:hypothetical protein
MARLKLGCGLEALASGLKSRPEAQNRQGFFIDTLKQGQQGGWLKLFLRLLNITSKTRPHTARRQL